jgi:superfamily II DNA or RNA helicase
MTIGIPWCGHEPYEWQEEALAKIEAMFGAGEAALVSAVTGSGKTLLLAELAARTPGTVLVTAPTQNLVEQLAGQLEERCPGEVGMCFQHAWQPEKRIVVTCIASLMRLVGEHPRWDRWLVDEAHGMESDALRELREAVVCGRRAGFTATPYRADKKGLIWWDGLAYRLTDGEAEDMGAVVPYDIVWREPDDPADVEELTARWLAQADGPGVITAKSIADADDAARRFGVLALHSDCDREERKRRLEALRTGEVRALVVVSLLAEGDDYPWLRWLILRAPTKSRTRLRQRVGRVVRRDAGKTLAKVYDPHDLCRKIGLKHEHVLEDMPVAEVKARPRIAELGDHETAGMPEAEAVEWWEGWAWVVLDRMVARGLVKPEAVCRGAARGAMVGPIASELLDRLAEVTALLPEEIPRGVVAWLKASKALRHGTAQDLVLVLNVVKKHGRCPVEVGRG